jgi:hypothetical protein
MRPKWLLTHPSGNLMVAESISGLNLDKFKKIYVVALQQHEIQYSFSEGLNKCFFDSFGSDVSNKLDIVLLESETKNQPETIFEAIEKRNIQGPIFIKDSDNFFECNVTPGNFVTTYDISTMESVNAGNKSYVVTDDNGIITSIVEKKVISSEFCAGGYSFESANIFRDSFLKLRDHNNLYISHMIYSMMLDGAEFGTAPASDYIDWGTLKEWNEYKSSFSTIFIDMDGVLVENSGRYFGRLWGSTEPLEKNVKKIRSLYDTGKCQIIITTSRDSSFEKATKDQLERIGVKYHQIIFNLMHCKRVIVNDHAPTNPYRSCDAINIKRNSDTLSEKIREIISEK